MNYNPLIQNRIKMKRLGTLLITVLVLGIGATAQSIQKTYKSSEILFERGLFQEALYGYEMVFNEDPTFGDAEYKREICILLTDKRERSMDRLLYLRSRVQDSYYSYWLGRAYMARYHFQDAVNSWKDFLDEDIELSEDMVVDIENRIQRAEDLQNIFSQPPQFNVMHMGHNINSEASDLSPVYNSRDKEMIFSSDRNTDFEFFRIYHAKQTEDDWMEPTLLKELGTLHPLAPNIEVVDEDGRLFLFDASKKNPLVFSDEVNGVWNKPKAFDTHLDGHEVRSHFYINEHEDRIIFGTDENSRTSGLDLYEVFMDPNTGEWSKAAPFAANINSEYDEDSPYLSPDEKTLYFSSDRPESLGGMDIFMTTLDEESGEWSDPVPLGYPINTPDDEVNFKINPDGTHGFLSSDRVGTKGSFDIYYFEKVEMLTIKGRVIASASGKPIQNANLQYFGSKYKNNFQLKTDEQGSYELQVLGNDTYKVEISQNGISLLEDQMDLQKPEDIQLTHIKNYRVQLPMEVSINTEMPKVQEKKATPTVTKKPITSLLKPSRLPVLYFEYGSWEIDNSMVPQLQTVLSIINSQPNLTLIISGYTDNSGSTDVNLEVSQRRSQEVAQWFLDQGIDAAKLIIRYYGEENPLATNDDEKEGRELNRRVSFEILTDSPNYVSKNLPNRAK